MAVKAAPNSTPSVEANVPKAPRTLPSVAPATPLVAQLNADGKISSGGWQCRQMLKKRVSYLNHAKREPFVDIRSVADGCIYAKRLEYRTGVGVCFQWPHEFTGDFVIDLSMRGDIQRIKLASSEGGVPGESIAPGILNDWATLQVKRSRGVVQFILDGKPIPVEKTGDAQGTSRYLRIVLGREAEIKLVLP